MTDSGTTVTGVVSCGEKGLPLSLPYGCLPDGSNVKLGTLSPPSLRVGNEGLFVSCGCAPGRPAWPVLNVRDGTEGGASGSAEPSGGNRGEGWPA